MEIHGISIQLIIAVAVIAIFLFFFLFLGEEGKPPRIPYTVVLAEEANIEIGDIIKSANGCEWISISADINAKLYPELEKGESVKVAPVLTFRGQDARTYVNKNEESFELTGDSNLFQGRVSTKYSLMTEDYPIKMILVSRSDEIINTIIREGETLFFKYKDMNFTLKLADTDITGIIPTKYSGSFWVECTDRLYDINLIPLEECSKGRMDKCEKIIPMCGSNIIVRADEIGRSEARIQFMREIQEGENSEKYREFLVGEKVGIAFFRYDDNHRCIDKFNTLEEMKMACGIYTGSKSTGDFLGGPYMVTGNVARRSSC